MKKILLQFIILFFSATIGLSQTFTVEQHTTGQNGLMDIRGQSFTPQIQGDGSGSVGSSDTVYLDKFSVIYASGTEPDTLYIYSAIPDSTYKLDNGEGGTLIGKSILKEAGDFPYTDYSFYWIPMHKDSTYYVLFRQDVNLEAGLGVLSDLYSGGSTIRNSADTINYSNSLDLKFIASFSPKPSDETDIINFSVGSQIGSSVINTDKHTVSAIVANSASLNSLHTTIEVSSGATYSPTDTYIDYSSGPVTFTVTAEDNITTQDWSVTITRLPVNIGDSLALVALYNSTDGPNWEDNTGWLQDYVSNWYGVTINSDRVTRISLYLNNLTGNIPEEIGNLVSLEYLYLNYNNISGNIPPEIGSLSSLAELRLGNNELSGNIPAEIGNLSNLTDLRLDHNDLSGNIPLEIGNLSNLSNLILRSNNLYGYFPSEVESFTNLSWVSISDNYFTFSTLQNFNNDSIDEFYYASQKKIQLDTSQVNINSGNDLSLDISELAIHEIEATNNQYQWWRDGAYMEDRDSITTYSSSPVLNVVNIENSFEGHYYCKIRNSDFPDLILESEPIHVIVDLLDGINNEIEILSDQWSIQPNPTSGAFYVTVDETVDYSQITIEIINSNGQVIFTTEMNSSEQLVNISDQPKGVYTVRIRGENILGTKKIILQ